VRAQVAAAIDVVVHVRRRGPTRQVQTISAVFRRGGDPVIETALTRAGSGDVPAVGPAWPALAHRLELDLELDPAIVDGVGRRSRA
jgi:pilus assembly protein CpaF